MSFALDPARMGGLLLVDAFTRYERPGSAAAEVVAPVALPGELIGRGPAEQSGLGRLVLPAGAERDLTAGDLVIVDGGCSITAWTQGARGRVASAGVTLRAAGVRRARDGEDLHVGLLPVLPDWSTARLVRVSRNDRDAESLYPVSVTLAAVYPPSQSTGKARPADTVDLRVAAEPDLRPGAAVELVDLVAGYVTVDRDDARLGIGARKSALNLFAAAVELAGSAAATPIAPRGRRHEQVVEAAHQVEAVAD